MKCEQKSGVFLNLDCQNTKEHKCNNCKKNVCKMHAHAFSLGHLCEDCYWEDYLYSKHEIDDNFIEGTYLNSDDASQTSSSDFVGGFDGGFGGGSFGGGGASGNWTEGDMQSLDDSSENHSSMLGSDDKFFYS